MDRDDRHADASPRTRWAGRPLVRLAAVGSTNDLVREAGRTGAPHGYAVLADAQTAGRGRRGRVWESPPGASLYLSVLLRPELELSDAAALALFAGLAVARACDRFVPPGAVTVKWPNDVRIHRKKIAGVLVEGAIRDGRLDAAIVGIGLNVAEREWPDALRDRATTLSAHAERPVSRESALGAVLEELESAVDAIMAGGEARSAAMNALRARCDTLGTRVSVDGITGVAEALEDDGALRVLQDDGSRVAVRSGELD
jgi:BirA family biotin operon repressor/biotin-[acetyl-CoA-carboxylase] ligase